MVFSSKLFLAGWNQVHAKEGFSRPREECPLKRGRLFAKLVLILCKGRYYLLKIMQKTETNSLQKEKSKQHIGAF